MKLLDIRHKLVANGYSQVNGVDFNGSFASMAKFITIRCIFALKTTMYWEIHQIDVKNGIFEWFIGGRDLYGSTKGFQTRRENYIIA